jgi:hypothetical protein
MADVDLETNRESDDDPKPGHFPEEQRKILREVALTYRRAQRAGKGQDEAADAAIDGYRRLSPHATGDKLAVSGEVNRMIAVAINVNPRWFWHGPDAKGGLLARPFAFRLQSSCGLRRSPAGSAAPITVPSVWTTVIPFRRAVRRAISLTATRQMAVRIGNITHAAVEAAQHCPIPTPIDTSAVGDQTIPKDLRISARS